MTTNNLLTKWQESSGNHRSLFLFTLVTVGLTVLTLALLYFYLQLGNIKSKETQAHLLESSKEIQRTLTKQIESLEYVSADLTSKLSSDGDSPEKVIEILHRIGSIYDGFIGIGVAYEPYALDEKLRLFSPYMLHQEHGYRTERMDAHYDYHGISYSDKCLQNSWYQCAKQMERGWLPISFDEISDTQVVRYVHAIKRNQTTIGYTYIDLDLEDINIAIKAVDTGDEGYATLFNSNGEEIFHSLRPTAHVENRRSFSEVFPDVEIQDCNELKDDKSKCNLFEVPNEVTEQPSYLHINKIKATDWNIAVVIEQEFFEHHELATPISSFSAVIDNNHHMMTLSLVLTVIFWSLLTKFVWMQDAEKFSWWAAFVIAVTFTLGIVYIWVEQQISEPDSVYGSAIVANDADLRRFVQEYSKTTLRLHKEPPIFIPTGVIVQAVKVDNENNMMLSGYVWQKFLLSNDYDIEKGVAFPESSETQIKQVYELEEQGYKTIGWEFQVKIPEHFDYQIYPFDKQLIWLRVWPKDYRKHVILLPDLDSYDSMNTSSRPGLEEEFSISGWRVKRSFFDLRINNFNSNMGIAGKVNKNETPELHYNIAISRNFIDPFVSYLFPVIIVLLMLYAVLLTNSKDENRIGLIGFNALEVLASASALFFVALLAHVELRSHIGANELIYMEYFFIIAYIMILIVSVNSILFSWGFNIQFIQYKDNSIPKLLYWPILTGLLFAFTMFAFW